MLPRLSSLAALLALLTLVVPAAAGADAVGHEQSAVIVLSGDVVVDRGETVDGVYIANGDARIAGRVDGDVVVLSGDALVSGTIDGNLFTASGTARLLPSAEVTGDVGFGDEHPDVALDARVHGDVEKQGLPDLGGLSLWIGGFLAWLAVGVSAGLLGILLLLIAPRAAEALYTRSRERIGPLIAIGIAILIVLPVAAVLAAITLLGLPLGLLLGLAMAPVAGVAYVVAAWALGRRLIGPPRERILAFLAGLAILRVAALVPILGLFVSLAAVILGLGLIGAAIGAARDPQDPGAAQSPDS